MQQFILAIFIIVAGLFSQGYAQSATSPSTVSDTGLLGVENYVLLNKRQYASQMTSCERTLNNFRSSFASQVSTAIDSQSVLLEKRINDALSSLNPLDVLTPTTRSCVQKYRSNIATVETIRVSIASCSASATNSLVTNLAAADTTRRNLANYYATNFEQILANCKKAYPVDKALNNYTLCVSDAIDTCNTVTVSNIKAFESQIQAAQCASDQKIREAIDCAYSIQYTTIASIGENTRLINNCIAGTDSCPVCPTLCQNSITVNATDVAISNDKIFNPFIGISANETCVQLVVGARVSR